jgi:SHS2 domain-containing protein
MPQKWGQHWPLPADVTSQDRDALVHTLGNLTLVSRALNPSMSNAGWSGPKGKRAALQAYSSIKLTADAIARADVAGGWDEEVVEERTLALIEEIIDVWSVPPGHTNERRHGGSSHGELSMQQLFRAGLVKEGQTLVTSNIRYPQVSAVISADGRIEFDGKMYDSPSGAGKAAATGRRAVNGWTFWRLGSTSGPKLQELRRQLAPEDLDEETSGG